MHNKRQFIMIKGRNIVIVGLQPWDIPIGSNCKNIAIELSRHNKVLYVNAPLDRSTYLKGKDDSSVKKRISIIKGKETGLVQVNENLWNLYPEVLAESINWIGSSRIFKMLNKVNNRRLADNILNATKSLNFDDIILFNDQSMVRCYHLKEYLKPSCFVYYIRDNLSTIEYFQRHALKMEEELIAEADVVATNSEFLAEYARKFNPNAKFVGQGCDFTLYPESSTVQISEEILHLPRPTIGYTGFLTNLRLDIKLLEDVASAKPDWQFVFVGPEDESFKKSNLHDLSNVHFLGNKTPESLPGYINGFDVAINPQLINEVTMGNYPRKIDEYLALGKPTVATATPFMEYFKDYTYLANGKDQWIEAIGKALSEDSNDLQRRRREFALSHSWTNNVEAISNLIESAQKINYH
jgi:glycosyltransferase involved in cell wall biosynthesis